MFIKHSFIEGNKGSFSNFKSHLMHRHKEEFENFEQNQEPACSSIRKYCVSSNIAPGRQQQLDMGLAKMFAEDNLPLNLLRRKGFRNWLAVMQVFKASSFSLERIIMLFPT